MGPWKTIFSWIRHSFHPDIGLTSSVVDSATKPYAIWLDYSLLHRWCMYIFTSGVYVFTQMLKGWTLLFRHIWSIFCHSPVDILVIYMYLHLSSNICDTCEEDILSWSELSSILCCYMCHCCYYDCYYSHYYPSLLSRVLKKNFPVLCPKVNIWYLFHFQPLIKLPSVIPVVYFFFLIPCFMSKH